MSLHPSNLRRSHTRILGASIALATGLATSALGISVPENFVVEPAFPGASFNLPTKVVFLPDGGALVAEIDGYVHVILPDGSQSGQPFLNLRQEVEDSTDGLGLLGVALDPDFEENRWVYFAYTVDPDFEADAASQAADQFSRLTRYQTFEGSPYQIDTSTRHVLIGATWTEGFPSMSSSHGICSVVFGTDNSLLVGHGDGAHFTHTDRGGSDPGGFGPGRTDPDEDLGAFRSRTLDSKSGAILRVDKETGLGLPDNPFWDGDPASNRSRIWLYGLRNPYRYCVRPGTGSQDSQSPHPGVLYIGDVGWNTYEELDIARDGGLNMGWPCREAAGENSNYQGVGSTEAGNTNVLCDSPLSPENPSQETDPVLWFHHGNSGLSNPAGWVGSSITGGTFYQGSSYPAEYQGRYFFGDYAHSWIMRVTVDADDNITATDPFLSDGNGPVDIVVDPATGDLVYAAIFVGQVYRIRYDDPAASVPSDTAVSAVSLQLHVSPNPAPGPISIRFQLEGEVPVTICIFDPNGRVVDTLRDREPMSPGLHEVLWEGGVGPGLYFVRVEAGRVRESTKLSVPG